MESLSNELANSGVDTDEALLWLQQSYKETAGNKRGFEIERTPLHIRSNFLRPEIGLWKKVKCKEYQNLLPFEHSARCGKEIGILTQKGIRIAEELISQELSKNIDRLRKVLDDIPHRYLALIQDSMNIRMCLPANWYEYFKVDIEIEWESNLRSYAIPNEAKSHYEKFAQSMIHLGFGVSKQYHTVREWKRTEDIQLNPVSFEMIKSQLDSYGLPKRTVLIRRWVNFNRGNMVKVELIELLRNKEVVEEADFHTLHLKYDIPLKILYDFAETLERWKFVNQSPAEGSSMGLLKDLSPIEKKLKLRIQEENRCWWEGKAYPPIDDELDEDLKEVITHRLRMVKKNDTFTGLRCDSCGGNLPDETGKRITCEYCGLVHILR